MGLQFNTPWLLMLIPFAIAYVVFTLHRTSRLTGARRWLAIVLRSLVLVTLIIALSGIQSYVSHDRQAVVFVVDRSDSMSQQQELLTWMAEATDHKREEDRTGVISFGAQALLERSLSERDLQQLQLNSTINPSFTNITAGLQLAENLDADDASMRIVLLSDGQENIGDISKQGLLLRNKGIAVDVLVTDQVVKKDVAIERLKIPQELYQGERYALDVTIQSTYETEGILRIYEDDVEISNQRVQIERGENHFVMQSVAVHTGLHRYRAEIYAADDEQAVNNVNYAFSRVSGPPRVLVVEDEPGHSHNLLALLDASFIPYDAIVPELLSENYEFYIGYESIIFNNVSGDRVPEQRMLMIEQAVRDFGVGFMMIGGERSFGLGGYFQTPLERALPVYMDLRGKREIPSLGLVLVIDRSGSMGGERIELAREAAIRTVELLRDQDTIGVLAFDSSPWWVVEPQKLTSRDEIIDAISSIQAEGGTEIYTAVEEGLAALYDIEAQRKHMILLTDGMAATNQNYSHLTADLAEHHITISTVAIGDGADQQLLQYIAQLGDGRYYFTNDQSTIPAIFSREAVLISRTYIVDNPFIPMLAQAGDWHDLFRGGLPSINAYIATTLKETAESALVSPEPDPLLARWQYGAGRAVAWTSDISGEWSGDWIRWEGLQQAFTEMIRWTFPQFQMSPLQLSSRLEGDRAILEVESHDIDFHGQLRAIITDEQLGQQEIELIPSMPGQYYAEFGIEQTGAYLTRINVYDQDPENDLIGSVTTGFVIPYSPEYKVNHMMNTDKLERLAELTGGRMLSLDHPEEVFSAPVAVKRMYYDWVPYFLMIALVLWLADIANRRLSFRWSSLLTSKSRGSSASQLQRTGADQAQGAGSDPHAQGASSDPDAKAVGSESEAHGTGSDSPATSTTRLPSIARVRKKGLGEHRRPTSSMTEDVDKMNSDRSLGKTRSNIDASSRSGASSSDGGSSSGRAPSSGEGPTSNEAPSEASTDRMSRLLEARKRGRR